MKLEEGLIVLIEIKEMNNKKEIPQSKEKCRLMNYLRNVKIN